MGLASYVASLDIESARRGIVRDIQEFAGAGVVGWVVLTLVFALPVMSLALLLRRRWLAVIPFLISFALFAVWFLYYATDWWSNPGQGVWLPAFALVLFGWLLVCVEVWRVHRRKQ